MNRRAHRAARRDEAGLTLIELLVTIAVMAAAFVALLAGFGRAIQATSAGSQDAQLVSLARQAGNELESNTIGYVLCAGPTGAAPTGYTKYQTSLTSALTIPTGYSVSITSITQSAGGTHKVSGSNVGLTAINSCASAGTSSAADYGVQQIVFKVASPTQSLSRTVYKRWN